MARGQKYSEEIKEKAYLMYATSGNYAEVARELDIPESTIKTWIAAKEPDELDGLRREKKEEFIQRASDVIDIALDRLVERLENDDNIPINHLTTVIGTMYDKRALAKGESTENTHVEFKMPKDMMKYAE